MTTPKATIGLKISLLIIIYCYFLFCVGMKWGVSGSQILAKSKLETCEKVSDSDNLNCTTKIVLNMAVPTGSSGGEASIVGEIAEVEENSTQTLRTRIKPVITVSKSAAYALYELTYTRDVPFKPEEFYAETRKCEPDASAGVVKICERLRDEDGHIIEHTQPICCPCGPERRVHSSCGKFFDKLTKGKANTAHCLRFPGDWFHVFSIGQRSLGFSVRIEVKTESKVSEVILGPENRTVISNDNFLRVNLIGDFAGYTNIPSFENTLLVIPRLGGPGEPQDLGRNFSAWMLLERVRFTIDGRECNKIGVGYEAFNRQPNFCTSQYGSCLENQLWNFWDIDQKRISQHQVPLYGVEGRFERINQHPNAGSHSFSIGVTEVLNTNLVIELTADDIEYVYQRLLSNIKNYVIAKVTIPYFWSPGKILNVTVPTFESLTQFGTATITAKNTGEVEASYSLTFDCSKSVAPMEEQIFILKPKESTTRSFKLYLATVQAAKYICTAILKDADFSEVDRAKCEFTTTATVLENGSQITPFQPPKPDTKGFFDSIKSIWNEFWAGVTDFFIGKTCRTKCSGFFYFRCHLRYKCMSWIIMCCLLLIMFPAVVVILWVSHQKGFFDHLYNWWEDHFMADSHPKDVRKHGVDVDPPHIQLNKHHKQEARHHKQEARHHKHHTHKRRSSHDHSEWDTERDTDYNYHHVHKDKHRHRRGKKGGAAMPEYENVGHHVLHHAP